MRLHRHQTWTLNNSPNKRAITLDRGFGWKEILSVSSERLATTRQPDTSFSRNYRIVPHRSWVWELPFWAGTHPSSKHSNAAVRRAREANSPSSPGAKCQAIYLAWILQTPGRKHDVSETELADKLEAQSRVHASLAILPNFPHPCRSCIEISSFPDCTVFTFIPLSFRPFALCSFFVCSMPGSRLKHL
ncbi:hypothetical protein BDW62DRAFT_138944 [Aspergillus aurantiobrunneus]